MRPCAILSKLRLHFICFVQDPDYLSFVTDMLVSWRVCLSEMSAKERVDKLIEKHYLKSESIG